MLPSLPPAWQSLLALELQKPYVETLSGKLALAYETETVYPPENELFSAFSLTQPEDIRVVILGQDPYHEPGQANGLAFSVREGVKLPPSLQNIYKELEADAGIAPVQNGDLTPWAKQGVFLLNTVLSVQAHRANSHKNFGWQRFTDAVIDALGGLPQPVAFILWGVQAQKKAAAIEKSPYPRKIIASAHPSPLSAYRGFFGSRPFSQVNDFLLSCGFDAIDWKIPEDAQKKTPLG